MALTLGGCGIGQNGISGADPTSVGLSTSLPLLWAESGDIRGQLAESAPSGWVASAIEQKGRMVPLDTIAAPDGSLPLPADGILILAQPRPLSPDENVALDAWVRAGGRLLLFADPMLTMHSRYALGDPRRPQAMAMLSPILGHWGLELRFDASQPQGYRDVSVFGALLPVNLPGQFRRLSASTCRLEAAGLGAECSIGKGRVLAIADAALFDGDDAGREAAWAALLDRIASR